MHLPDPSVIGFGTAVVSLATALTGLVRLILEKKSKSLRSGSIFKTNQNPGTPHLLKTWFNAFKKNTKSVPRGMRKLLEEKENPYITGSFALQTSVRPLQDVDICFSCVDNDHIDAANLNRLLKKL